MTHHPGAGHDPSCRPHESEVDVRYHAKEATMTRELGVWTADECALVLIDYQNEMFEVIRSETNADLVEMHVRLLAKTAAAFKVPIVLSTVGVGAGFNGPTLPSILSELPGIPVIDRSSMNAFEDSAFREAVKLTGRKRLIIGGVHHGSRSPLSVAPARK